MESDLPAVGAFVYYDNGRTLTGYGIVKSVRLLDYVASNGKQPSVVMIGDALRDKDVDTDGAYSTYKAVCEGCLMPRCECEELYEGR